LEIAFCNTEKIEKRLHGAIFLICSTLEEFV
jgi:hypothetical protein